MAEKYINEQMKNRKGGLLSHVLPFMITLIARRCDVVGVVAPVAKL